MARVIRWGVFGIVATVVAATMSVAGADEAPKFGQGQKKVCKPDNRPGVAECHAHVATKDKAGITPLATATYSSGYRPSDLKSAYKLPAAPPVGWTPQTIAIVDAYDNPKAAADVSAYRSQFGLVPADGATGHPWFKKIDQNGGTNYPTADTGWGQEIALDIEMASAVCPMCNILLVEAKSSYMTDLGAAVNQAVAQGANVVSNSYGGSEYSSETSDDNAYFNHPGVAITVSSGDSGYGAEYPAASKYVTAVGGTSLSTSSSARGWSESAWSGAGSGCSSYETKPSWQKDTGCSRRTVSDVSAIADPNTGVAVYDANTSATTPWMVFGGTSVAAPIIGSVYALAGTNLSPQTPYQFPSTLFDVTSGSNLSRCTRKFSASTSYLCSARTGYDGPTGLGTPNGTASF